MLLNAIRGFVGSLGVAMLLAGCGGGGGSAGTTSTGGTQSGGGTTTGTSQVTVELRNAAGTAVSSISVEGGFTARATVKDASGAVVANKLVTFASSAATIATVSPATALTNSAGVAEVAIAPTSVTAVGAATVTASATVNGAAVTGSRDFAITPLSLSLSAITPGSASLVSGGNTSLSVTALIGGVPAGATPVNVNYAASCGRINGSNSGFSVTTNGSGVASADYAALQPDGSPCSGNVVVTAASPGATSRTLTLQVAAPTATSVTFKSATPSQIYVAGSGALEQSIVTFKVTSATGAAMSGVSVNFGFPNGQNPLGLLLGATSGLTNASGEVSVAVNSGTIPGPARVRASLASDASIFTDTQNFTVASGPPSQRYMSLSVATHNIEGWVIDGTATKVTVRLADRQGNAVEDGTVVNFTAEGGQVGYSCATQRVNNIASCSVDFISQNFRPANGRVSVLAYTTGTKDYVDANGNNRFDAGESLVNQGDAYRDDNENGQYDAGEFVIARGGATSCTGAGGAFPSRANTCDAGLATTVRQQAIIAFASSASRISTTAVSGSQVSFILSSADHPYPGTASLPSLPMPAGTVIEAAPSNPASGCQVTRVTGTPLVDVALGTSASTDTYSTHSVFLSGTCTAQTIIITTKSPSGLTTSHSVPIP
ncbi:hypothetical protein ACT80S_15435 [Ramlibacter sp. MAHUQ-53]|uniref:hypothetical protein n=1 Tax=unclassified Ramlibacter TaxID=2617605 RepID=UPI00363C9ED9